MDKDQTELVIDTLVKFVIRVIEDAENAKPAEMEALPVIANILFNH